MPGVQNMTMEWDLGNNNWETVSLGNQTFQYEQITSINDTFDVNCAGVGDETPCTFSPAEIFDNATLLRCDLANDTYDIDFRYVDGVQDVHVRSDRSQSPVMDALAGGQYVLGPSSGPQNCTLLAFGGGSLEGPNSSCSFYPNTLRWISYQAIMQAFNQLVIGSIGQGLLDDGGGTWVSGNEYVPVDTIILKTTLAQTDEMVFLQGPGLG